MRKEGKRRRMNEAPHSADGGGGRGGGGGGEERGALGIVFTARLNRKHHRKGNL